MDDNERTFGVVQMFLQGVEARLFVQLRSRSKLILLQPFAHFHASIFSPFMVSLSFFFFLHPSRWTFYGTILLSFSLHVSPLGVCLRRVSLFLCHLCRRAEEAHSDSSPFFFFLCVISSQFLLSTDFYRRRNDDLNILFFNYFSLENNHFFLFSFFFHLSAYTLAFCAHSVRKI